MVISAGICAGPGLQGGAVAPTRGPGGALEAIHIDLKIWFGFCPWGREDVGV